MKKHPEPIVTPHASDYTGWQILSIVKTDSEDFVVVIDNSDDEFYRWYNTELANNEQEVVSFMELVCTWQNDRADIPLSIYLSNRNVDHLFYHMFQQRSKIGVQHIIGPVAYFDMIGGRRLYGKQVPSRPKTKRIRRKQRSDKKS